MTTRRVLDAITTDVPPHPTTRPVAGGQQATTGYVAVAHRSRIAPLAAILDVANRSC